MIKKKKIKFRTSFNHQNCSSTKIQELFGFSVSITYNLKMVGYMAEKFVWIFITLFQVFISITQFSDFLVMNYENWKHILSIFSFHNSVFNSILVIKHTWKDPLVRVSRNFWPFFFSFFSTVLRLLFILFFFFFLFAIVSSFFLFFFFFLFFIT